MKKYLLIDYHTENFYLADKLTETIMYLVNKQLLRIVRLSDGKHYIPKLNDWCDTHEFKLTDRKGELKHFFNTNTFDVAIQDRIVENKN